MGKQLLRDLTALILLFFAVSLTVGSACAASDSTNSTILSDPAPFPVTNISTASDPSIDSTSVSDLIKNLAPQNPDVGYVAIIDIEQIVVSLKHIVVVYIPTSDLKDGKIPVSSPADFSDASGNLNPVDLSSLGISTTDPTGSTNIISPAAGGSAVSDPKSSDPINTGSSNTGNSNKGSCTSPTCKPTTDKSSTNSKPTTNSKPSTCKPTTSIKPATSSKTSTYKPTSGRNSICKPTKSKTSTGCEKSTNPASSSKKTTKSTSCSTGSSKPSSDKAASKSCNSNSKETSKSLSSCKGSNKSTK